MAKATALYARHTKAELVKMLEDLDAKMSKSEGSIFRGTSAQRKLGDAISWAIAYHMADERKPSVDGYSGRNSNRAK